MVRSKTILFPKQARELRMVGENIKLARLRRHLTCMQVAERAGISRTTLSKIESGEFTVTIESLYKVLYILGLNHEFARIAQIDTFGHDLEDAKLLAQQKGPKRKNNP